MSAPRTGDWTRNSDAGSAFSGLGRGGGRRGNARGGGGPRGGRGSRGGGRGGGSSRTASASTAKPPAEPVAKNDPPAEPSKPPVDTSKPPPSNTEKPANAQRPKPPSRKGSTARPIPTIITPTTSTETAMSTATVKNSSRPPNRRKRSQTNSKAADNLPKIEVPAADDSHLRPQKGRGVKANLPIPPHTAPLPKDTSPHLSANSAFDARNNIDALVERVRAVAMDRPSTPGSHSHIDWAGDDDDSLPDLDDWGVNPSTTTSTANASSNDAPTNDLISPIMIDGLKSLPDPGKHSPNSVVDSVSPLLSAKDIGSEKPEVGAAGTNTTTTQKNTNEVASKVNNHRGPPKLPLHPSLPPKPSFADAAPVLSHRAGATPMRSPLNSKFQTKGPKVEEKGKVTAKVPEPKPNVQEPSMSPALSKHDAQPIVQPPSPETLSQDRPQKSNDEKRQQTSHEADDLTEGKAGLEASQHAPKPVAEDIPDSGPGLQASIHAPKALSESSATPPAMIQKMVAEGGHGHIMTHNRAHTIGRPHALSPQGGLHSRFSRSGTSTPRNGHFNSPHHARTHSTPPAGTSPHAYRTPHATRPVITGDAISRLARTIGGTAISPSRNPVALASKE
ncbi:hypothetical protein V5O48_007635 [Marasmius crinis-equi]|uniref:Uncharacterized protein n=1 Tax=Marasmius crinis-equi TaxID=585013 RepID=A0ABR3FG41_9AGAR